MKGFGAEPEIVWHYTLGEKLFPIGDSQLLKTEIGYVPPGDKPVVWFTRSEIYEPSAYPAWVSGGVERMLTSLKDVAEKGKGLLRIGIAADDPCLKTCTHWANNRQYPEFTESLLSLAREKVSNPEKDWFVSYKFLPGVGFYGFGLYHMIGGLGKAATGSLRALLDSAAFANMQGGFKLRGRVAGGEKTHVLVCQRVISLPPPKSRVLL